MKQHLFLLLCLAAVVGLLSGCTLRAENGLPVTTEPCALPSSVTAGGFNVHTDYSSYTAREHTFTSRYSRLSEGKMPELVASDSYGMIYPYIGAVQSDDWISLTYFGFADRSGCLLTDAAYLSLHAIESDGERIWLFSQVTEASEFVEQAYDELLRENADLCYGAMALDGSFVLPCVYERITVDGGHLVAVYPIDEGEAVHFEIYDFRGNRLLDSDELPYADRLYGNSWDFRAVGDLFTVGMRSGEYYDWDEAREAEIADCYLADMDGALYGPYSYVQSDRSGYFIVDGKSGERLAVTSDGTLLAGSPYHDLSYGAEGQFVARKTEDDPYCVIDTEGNIVFTAPQEFELYWDGNSYNVTSNYISRMYYDRDGRRLGDFGNEQWWCLHVSGLYYRSEDGVITLYDAQNDTKTELPGDSVGELCDELPYIVVGTWDEDSYGNREKTVLYDRAFSPVMEFYGSCSVLYDSADGTPYLAVDRIGSTTIYDCSLNELLTLPGSLVDSEARLHGGVLSYYVDTAAYLTDLNGDTFLCYPLFGLMDD